jgi:hypothetical protein
MASTIYFIFDNLPIPDQYGLLRGHNANYFTAHDGPGAVELFSNYLRVGQGTPPPVYDIFRSVIDFVTILLNGLTPTAAQVIFYSINAGADEDLCVVDGSLAHHPLINADYQTLLVSTTIFGQYHITPPLTLMDQTPKIAVLNAFGIAALNPSGITRFGLRCLPDINRVAPPPVDLNNFWAILPNLNPFAHPDSITYLRPTAVDLRATLQPIALPPTGSISSPILLRVDVAEGSSIISNIDVRLCVVPSSYVYSRTLLDPFDINSPLIKHSPWSLRQQPFVNIDATIFGLTPSTDYFFYVEWRFNGTSTVYYLNDGPGTSQVPKYIVITFSTPPGIAVLKKAYALGRHEL